MIDRQPRQDFVERFGSAILGRFIFRISGMRARDVWMRAREF
jgi:hypothetical protein